MLLGISTYARAAKSPGYLTLEDIENRRERVAGGLLTPPSYTQTRWYMSDLEAAERLTDQGNLKRAAQLMLAARKDGYLSGVLSTRTGGVVRLPRIWRGDAEIIGALERGYNDTRAAFDEMNPPSELANLAADGLTLGAGLAELIPVRGRQYPVLVRYDPQHLRFDWTRNQWLYDSIHGPILIEPGNGRWVLHSPGGRIAPWQLALWRALGQPWIRKQHAQMYRDNWEAKLAHPARVAYAPQGASEPQKEGYFAQVMQWGINTVFGLTPGYEVKLLESNGRGWESFTKTIAECNQEFIIAIAGQEVTTTGGTGFANADIHKSIRADLIKETADGLAHTINTQIIPAFVTCVHGASQAMTRRVTLEYDVTPPKDRNNEAQAMGAVASAVKQLTESLETAKLAPDVKQIVDRFNIPTIAVQVPDDLQGGGIGDPAQDSALNGAQIASLLEVVGAVARGEIPRDSALAIIKRAFMVDEATADALLGTVGAGFIPMLPGAPPSAALPPGDGTPVPSNTEVIDA